MNILLPFQFVNLPIRGRIVVLKNLDAHIPSLRTGTEAACTTLSELLTLAALMVHDGKHELAVTLQIQHSPTGSLLFAACNEQGELKAYANPAGQVTPFEKLTDGQGQFAVTLDPIRTEQRYQSLVALSEASAAACLQRYYTESAQTPTLIHTASGICADGSRAAAVLFLQGLPQSTEEALASELNEQLTASDDWQRMALLLSTLTPGEMLNDEPQTLLSKVFAEDDVTVYPAEHPEFSEADPRPRMLAALASLPKEELAELIHQGTVTLTDETSGKQVSFSAADLSHLLSPEDGASTPQA